MLNNLWGDMLRIMAGDVEAGTLLGVKATQGMWFAVAILMVIPIVMVFLSLTLNNPVNRWANIIVGIIFMGLNLGTLAGFPYWYKSVIIVGIGFNVLTVWYAWKWVP